MLADEHGPYIPFYLSVVCSFEPEKIYDPYVEIFSGYATPLDHSGCYLSHQSQSQLMHTQRVIKAKLGPKKNVSQRLNKVRPRRNAYSGRSLSLRVVECTRRPFCLFLINRWPRRLPAHLGIDIKGLANLRSSKCCKEEYLWQPYLVGETFHIDFQVRYVLTNYMYLSYRQVFQFCRFLAGFLFLHLLDFYFSILFPYRVTLKVHKYFATS